MIFIRFLIYYYLFYNCMYLINVYSNLIYCKQIEFYRYGQYVVLFVLEQEEGWLIGIKDSTGEKKMFPANFTRPLWEPHCRKRKEITKRPSILKFSFWMLLILFYVFMYSYVYSNEIWYWSLTNYLKCAATTSILMAFLFYKLNTALIL